MKDHIEQRFVNLDATVVFDEAHLAKTVHEETDARAGSPDHIRESLLRNWRNQRLLFARLAELGHQQKKPRQPLFGSIEELIDEIGLDAHTAGQQVSHEHLRKSVLLMHDADHLIAFDLECNTVNNGRCSFCSTRTRALELVEDSVQALIPCAATHIAR